MKKTSIVTILILMLLVSVNAQTSIGYDYFKGKWNISASGPTGDVKMVASIEKSGDRINCTLKDQKGNDLYKVVNVTMKDAEAIINFIGSQGEVSMVLNKKDENHLTGDIMNGMAFLTGERITGK